MNQVLMSATRIFNILDLYVYSLVILCVIAFKTYMNEDRDTSQSRLFRTLLALNMALLVVDGLSSGINGREGGSSRIFLEYVSVADLSLQTFVSYIWVLFVREVSNSRRRGTTADILLAAPLAAVVAILLATPFAHLGFTYDSSNRYARTAGTYVIIATDFAYIVLAYVIAIRSRRRNGRKKTTALLSFALAPAICGVLQVFLPAIILVWPALTISLLINYLAIQNEQLFLDHLTGVNNRRSLDIVLKRKLAANRNAGIFGLIFIDLDDFKAINDTWGHIEGDRALEAAARILRKCFHHGDFISRYGGDEFVVIADIGSESDIDAIKCRLADQLSKWNEESSYPWKLSFSTGSISCAPGSFSSADQCLRHIDAILYQSKKKKKEGN